MPVHTVCDQERPYRQTTALQEVIVCNDFANNIDVAPVDWLVPDIDSIEGEPDNLDNLNKLFFGKQVFAVNSFCWSLQMKPVAWGILCMRLVA